MQFISSVSRPTCETVSHAYHEVCNIDCMQQSKGLMHESTPQLNFLSLNPNKIRRERGESSSILQGFRVYSQGVRSVYFIIWQLLEPFYTSFWLQFVSCEAGWGHPRMDLQPQPELIEFRAKPSCTTLINGLIDWPSTRSSDGLIDLLINQSTNQ